MSNRVNKFSDAVRSFSFGTLSTSEDLLSIDNSALESILLERVIKFKNDGREGKNPFDLKHLGLNQELGVNIFFNAVNFCFKDPETKREYRYLNKEGREIGRSTGLFTALTEADIDWDNLAEVGKIDLQKWLEITQLSNTNILYIGPQRVERIQRLATFFISLGLSSTSDFLSFCDFDAINILEQLIASEVFVDIFLKRAQVVIHNVENVLHDKSTQVISNSDTLSCMADYRIPQVFYNLGVVSLADNLKSKIGSEEIILAGSREELALRSSVIVIGNKLAKLLNISESEVDGLLWKMSQEMAKKQELTIPHMIVPTDCY